MSPLEERDIHEPVVMCSCPVRLWVADLTLYRTAEGWLYAAIVLDAFFRRVIGWGHGRAAGHGVGG